MNYGNILWVLTVACGTTQHLQSVTLVCTIRYERQLFFDYPVSITRCGNVKHRICIRINYVVGNYFFSQNFQFGFLYYYFSSDPNFLACTACDVITLNGQGQLSQKRKSRGCYVTFKSKNGEQVNCVKVYSCFQYFDWNILQSVLGCLLNRYDVIMSSPSSIGERPDFILPDRKKYVSMDKKYLKSYMDLVIKVWQPLLSQPAGKLSNYGE